MVVSTRARIVTATNELFRAKGYHGTSLAEVTAAADAPTGSIYHFFPDGKAALAATAIRESGDAYKALFELIADAAKDPAEAVGTFFDGAADELEGTDFIEICPIGGLAREMANADESIRLATSAVFTRWVSALTARLRRVGISEDDAEALASTVIAALEGSFVLARSHRDATAVRSAGRHMKRLIEDHVEGLSH
jgi:AcrR family transcriptional regulator